MSTATASALPASSALSTNPARFAEDGYCVFRGLLEPSEIADCRTALDRTIAERSDVRWERLTEPHIKDEFWLRQCCHPRVLDAVSSVLGDDLVLLMSHLIVKPPRDGLSVAWHQDNSYWESVVGTDIVTVWLAIDDADRDNGCMEVLPRTQAGRLELPMIKTDGTDLLGVRVEVDPAVEASRLCIELRAGDASIHDSHIIHGSRANPSPRRRAGYTMRYGSARTTQVDVAKHWVPVWLVKGEAPSWAGWKDGRGIGK